ncbi:hypothetical protein BUALT_Bualt12G0096000 [Buddleja alternifolia]|uniref:Response regulatory domain-containing protein n=1 Tax=Buddleja alternifolia TaxID=168488 RepID=A0AAV6X0M7_9LAMI|nr:hypothetical protein BUALT_Bualt12G0096000 [Buddleja alternifolia]
MLRKKNWDLDWEVGIIKKQKEASWHVRMLTQEIRKSLNWHTILYTTLVDLSKTLDLHNCAVWMPNAEKVEMNLTHELNGRSFSNVLPIPRSDPDVREIKIKENDGVKILDSELALAVASSGGTSEPGAVAAIRMPMLKPYNFKGGTPEMVHACYAILVLVFQNRQYRSWSHQELEIVDVVADQVVVALFHASVLEESQLMREKLVEQNRALEQAKQVALIASQARYKFQTVMSNGLRRPMHSVLGLLSVWQDEKLSDEQSLLVEHMVKSSNVLSTLITDIMKTSGKDNGRFSLEIKPFQLHSMIKEAVCLSKCLCAYWGYDSMIDVNTPLPNHVMGDVRRVFLVILDMVGNLLYGSKRGGCSTLRLYSASASKGWNDQRWAHRRLNSRVGIFISGLRLGFSIPLMQGYIWVVTNPEGFDQSMALIMRFQIQPAFLTEHGESSSDQKLLEKLLKKLGCIVSAVSSGHECLTAVGPVKSLYKIVLLDLHLPDLDGFEVVVRIRKFRSRSWPLIISLSASNDGDTRDRCLRIGMNGVIQKSGLFQEIANELKRIVLQVIHVLVCCASPLPRRLVVIQSGRNRVNAVIRRPRMGTTTVGGSKPPPTDGRDEPNNWEEFLNGLTSRCIADPFFFLQACVEGKAWPNAIAIALANSVVELFMY